MRFSDVTMATVCSTDELCGSCRLLWRPPTWTVAQCRRYEGTTPPPLVGPNTTNVITTDAAGHHGNASVLISSVLEEHRDISDDDDDAGADGPVSQSSDAE